MKEKTHEILVRNLSIRLDQYQQSPCELVARRLGVNPKSIVKAEIIRRAIDARGKSPKLVLHLRARVHEFHAGSDPDIIPLPSYERLAGPKEIKGKPTVAIVGTGPAGLFAAWRLVQAGLAPTIIDRGPGFPQRHEAVQSLRDNGVLDTEANFHFGLGGGGTYSDGKLYTRLDRTMVRTVLEVLQQHGAGSRDEILIDAHPHVGTDRWPDVLQSLVVFLQEKGCTFQFKTLVTGTIRQGKKLRGLRLEQGSIHCQAAILAPGNSSRDLYESLHTEGITMEPKAFAVGVRMVHPQSLIDEIQYGKAAGHPALGPATYRLSGKFSGRGVYSFCMCPGGEVIPTPTEPGLLAINGMSDSRRSSGKANSAMVVQVSPGDFPSPGPLGGVEFQRKIEKAAYQAGGGNYAAPGQLLLDFLAGTHGGKLAETHYRPSVKKADLDNLLPSAVSQSLRQGLAGFCKRMKGLANDKAMLLGVESRTSSPVRIVRNPDGMSSSTDGLFPTGEGAGYAGGITSSAVDGIRQADAVIEFLSR